MTHDDGFDNRPSRAEAPDGCQHNGCSKIPDRVVRFWNPKEYLCYCGEHTAEHMIQDDGARREMKLR